ncbi:MAG: hypothetical protein RLZZ385_1169 [Pseudomonadota bacterium]
MLAAGAGCLLVMLPFASHYSSFFREHKVLRYYSNPLTFIYAGVSYGADSLHDVGADMPRQAIGTDARIPAWDHDRELIILVVGETARADHFSLNGYVRDTNPVLATIPSLISFNHMESCATSTALSLPCMFFPGGSGNFDVGAAASTENALDVLQHAGVNVLWRDNNSDSKGVAIDVPFEDFKVPEQNPVCDIECRDEGMLTGLDDYIGSTPEGDILIVLHQMGNHGPAYHKRYPADFENFTPVCTTNQLEQCSVQEINNAYDNAIRYTDHFLGKVIEFLKGYDDRFETAMFYVSDHGESLGEHGLFLHGLPNFMAPDEQRQVAAILWFGDSYGIDQEMVRTRNGSPLSHDHVFHTILGLMEIQTAVYAPDKDLLAGAHI